jgi:hypothetical protein
MKTEISVPELGLVAMTRGFLGAGVALVLGDQLAPPQRRAVGWTLIGVGALTTIPLLFEIFGHRLKAGGTPPTEPPALGIRTTSRRAEAESDGARVPA